MAIHPSLIIIGFCALAGLSRAFQPFGGPSFFSYNPPRRSWSCARAPSSRAADVDVERHCRADGARRGNGGGATAPMKRSGRWGELFGDVRTNGGTTRMYAGESSEATEEGSELAPSSSSAAAEEEGARGGSKPVVAVIGSGAVGCYYGGRLWESGRYDVKFHMRGEHYEKSKANGLNITSVHGDMFIPPETLEAYDAPENMGKADWVIVALKSTALSAAPALVRPLLKPTTRVLAIMNGLVDEDLVQMLEEQGCPEGEERGGGERAEQEARSSPPAGVTAASASKLTCCAATFGGMALVCCNKIAPGHVDHSYAGKLTVALASSSDDGPNVEFTHREAMEDLWRDINIEYFVYEENIVRGRWSKMCWNLPFNGISVAMGGITIDKVVTDPGLRRLAYVVIDETISAANADLESRGANPSMFLGQAEKDAMMTLSDGMGPYKTSTMLDFTHRRPMEVQYLFRKAVERANRLNVPVPHLETLVTQIEAFQRFYGL